MRLRVLFPIERLIESDNRDDFIEQVQSLYSQEPIVRSNTVISLEGNASDDQGVSDGLSNHVDRAVLAALRRNASVVLVGGQTARTERYRKPLHSRLAILSQSGNLAEVPALSDSEGPKAIVIGLPETKTRLETSGLISTIEFVDLGAERSAVNGQIAAIGVLKNMGLTSIVNESGINQIRILAADGILDEICLTVTKKQTQRFSPKHVSIAAMGVAPSGYELTLLATAQDSIIMNWRRVKTTQ